MLLCFSLQLSNKSANLFPTIFSVSVFLDCPCVIPTVSPPPAFSLLSPLSSVISQFLARSHQTSWSHGRWPVSDLSCLPPSVIPYTVPFQLCHTQDMTTPWTFTLWTFTLWRQPVAPPSYLTNIFTCFHLPWAPLQPDPCCQSPQGFLHSCSQDPDLQPWPLTVHSIYADLTIIYSCCQSLINWNLTNLH